MKFERTFLLGILLFGLTYTLSAQGLDFQLLDKETKEPIRDAFVFVASTSIGSSTDLEGRVTLEVGRLGQIELVISHINYELKSFTLEPGETVPTTIYLQVRALAIDEVVVKSRASEKRKLWLKQFEEAFLGPFNKRNRVKLMNPQVLLFQEDAEGLKAEATDYIDIANEILGYRLRFYLDTFLLDTIGDVRYAGKVFFQELSTAKAAKRVSRARKRAFRNGKQYFLRWLIQNPSQRQPKAFIVGTVKLDEARKKLAYKKQTVDKLVLRRGVLVDTLMIPDFLVITDPQLPTKAPIGALPFRIRKFASSMLRSKTGYLLIDRSGEIVNPKDIEEYGHWTTQRVGDLIPIDFDYEMNAEDESIDGPFQLSQRLNDYLDSLPQEKLFLHLNKPYYSNREEIHYKGYLVDAYTNLIPTPSRVVYVELISPSGEIVVSQQLHVQKGLEGTIALDKGYVPGEYQVRAYTHYMRNFDPGFFYRQAVGIFDPFAPSREGQEMDTTALGGLASEPLESESSFLRINFFPEGGDLVNGLRSKVSFKVVDERGRAVDLSVRLLDDRREQLLETATLHQGVGLFSIQPIPGRSYMAVAHYQGQDYQFALPPAKDRGYVMRVNNNRQDRLYIELSASPELGLQGSFLLGHVRGQTFCLATDLSEEEAVVLHKSILPEGLAHFTLFDPQGQPVAERLVFNYAAEKTPALDIKQAYSHFFPRQKVELELQLKKVPVANLSAAVVDQGVIRYSPAIPNAQSWFLLNADLGGRLPNASYYLQGQSQLLQLDLLLMTYGWRRFRWRDLRQPQALAYTPEQGFSVQGYTIKPGETKERIQADVMLSTLSNDFYVEKTTTDASGNFNFYNLPQLDSTDFIIQGQVHNPRRKNAELKMTGKRQVQFHFVEEEKPVVLPLPPARPIIPMDGWETYAISEQEQDSLRNADWVIDLEEVTVRENRGTDTRIFNAYNLNEMDWIPPERPAFALLSNLKPGSRYRRELGNGQLVYFKFTPRGYVRIPLRIFVDGILVSHEVFQTLTADLINYISINGPAISVFTRRNGPRSWQTRVQNGILNFTHPAYHQAREFYEPTYGERSAAPEKTDLRTAVHWEPQIQFNSEGKAKLSFYTADTPSTYAVRIEGIQQDGEPVSQVHTFQVNE